MSKRNEGKVILTYAPKTNNINAGAYKGWGNTLPTSLFKILHLPKKEIVMHQKGERYASIIFGIKRKCGPGIGIS